MHVELPLAQPATVRLMPSTATEPLRMKYGASAGGKPIVSQCDSAFRPNLLDHADAVDVSQHEVAVEPAVGPQRALEVHLLAALQRPSVVTRAFRADVGEHVLAVDQDHRSGTRR